MPVPVFSIFGTTTSGSLAYNGSEKTSAFLEQYGTVAAQDIIVGLTPPSADSLAYTYLHAGGAHSIIGKDATLRFDDSDNNYSFSSTHLTLTQHLFTGLFVQVYGQFVEQSLAQRPTASGPDANDSAVKRFLDDFDSILYEYDLPPLTEHKRSTSLERCAILAGWSGESTLQNSLFEHIRGSLSGGYVSTPPSFNHPLHPLFFPIISAMVLLFEAHFMRKLCHTLQPILMQVQQSTTNAMEQCMW